MKPILTLSLILVAFVTGIAQGIDFFHGTWKEALEKANEENKVIFVDAYTTWCGPCKRMAANVFTRDDVGEFFNANFINMKLDMEQDEGRKFGRKYPVSAYPTFYFIDGTGKVVINTKGGRQPEDFIDLGKMAVEKYDNTAKYRTLYDKGDRSYEVVYGYVTELAKSGQSPVRVANAYLGDQEDLSSKENLSIILAATWQADSKIFEALVPSCPMNKKAIINNAKPYIKKYIKDDHTELSLIALDVMENFTSDDECVSLGIKAITEAQKLKPSKASYVLTHATLLYVSGDKEGAIKVLEQAIAKEEPDSKARMKYEGLKKKMEAA